MSLRPFVSAVAGLLMLAPAPARSDQLRMPYACASDQGRLALAPVAAPRTYEVVQHSGVRRVRICLGPRATRCDVVNVHRFDIVCGGTRIEWVNVAAAALRLSHRPATVEDGRLVLFRAAPRSIAAACRSPGSAADRFPGAEPAPRCRRPQVELHAIARMPPGFAPVDMVGARLLQTPPPEPLRASSLALARAIPPDPPSPTLMDIMRRKADGADGGTAKHAPRRTETPTALQPSPQASLDTPGREPVLAAAPADASRTTGHRPLDEKPRPAAFKPEPASEQPTRPSSDAKAARPPPRPPGKDANPAAAFPDGQAGTAQGAAAANPPAVPQPAAPQTSSAPSAWHVTVATDAAAAAQELAERLPAPLRGAWTGIETLGRGPGALAALAALLALLAVTGRHRASRLVATAGAGATLRTHTPPDHRAHRNPAVREPTPMPSGHALEETVGQLMCATDMVINRLGAAPPLQGVLRQEVEVIRHRLSLTERVDGTPLDARQRQIRHKTAIRELYRIVKIAEGACESFAGRAAAPALPQTREAALHLLGVNPDVSPAILKKVVDALRVSWHPDHARDEEDRLRREERTKQINVAWDLIRERPAAPEPA